jgi:hypothetical protein
VEEERWLRERSFLALMFMYLFISFFPKNELKLKLPLFSHFSQYIVMCQGAKHKRHLDDGNGHIK